MSAPVLIGGAGPAGLTAAYELARNGVETLVLEAAERVGGLARTELYKGYRFDIGGHRFYTKAPDVQQLWEDLLGDEFLLRPRLSRIFFNRRFFQYPLSLTNVVGNLGLVESLRILGSYLQAHLRPVVPEETFEQWVVNRFGWRLYRTFFKTYTEKVWGIPCHEIRAEWAAQRIKDLSLVAAVSQALFGHRHVRSLVEEFHYPRLGPGQMWERCRERVEELGGQVLLQTPIHSLRRRDNQIISAIVGRNGDVRELPVDRFVSSLPLGQLILRLDPPPPVAVLEAARSLKYRDFILVALIIRQADLFPDNWIYVHAPDSRVGRIQNFKNWSPDMVPDPTRTCLGMEYFCTRGDDLWRKEDSELLQLAAREIEQLGLAREADVEDGCVIRQPKAYPVYDGEYRRHLQVIREYLEGFKNLQTVGRNGMHRYNNQDHSMLCGLFAARNLLGASYDVWEVNTERSYYEEQRFEPPRPPAERSRPRSEYQRSGVR
ncbi:MAG: NAD(P)/FAD-dependent oxidoreductase [Planctomycetaceae bacterium]